MQNFTVKISLNDEEMEGVKRLNALTKEILPDIFGKDTLEDTIGFVARSGFERSLLNMLNTYQKSLEKEV